MKEITLSAQEAFRKHYTNYAVMEALTTTSPEDREETISYVEESINTMEFSQVVEAAIADGIIDSIDDVIL